MKPSRDKTTALLKIASGLDADSLEDLISQLALLRSDMTPPVPHSRPDPTQKPDKHVTIEDDPAMTAVRLKDGRIRLWARNRGTGWMAYNMATRDACALRDYLSIHLPETGKPPSLFSDGDGQTH
ncbi:MAG: hypothetical protein ACRECD_01240 [Burkholderiaceae bacterium]